METPAQPQHRLQPPPPLTTTITTTTTATTTTTTTQLNIPPPQTALSLLPQSITRHHHQQSRRKFPTGCAAFDEHVLLGGLNGGSVVGISSEDDEFSFTLALQTMAVSLGGEGDEDTTTAALVVTTLPVQSLLPRLREVLVEQLAKRAPLLLTADLNTRVKDCLSRISIARVFDLEGVGEVLEELVLQQRQQQQQQSNCGAKPPDVVVVMGMAGLMNNLFSSRPGDKAAAHSYVGELASRLEGVTALGGDGGPLVVLLNSTTTTTTTTVVGGDDEGTGRSVFQMERGRGRGSRPAWGRVFDGLVGVHLFCGRRGGIAKKGWVVEVLGDEVGVYFTTEGGMEEEVWTRRNREQRWGVLEGRGGGVVDVLL
ncbi:hypothetical protein QBC41DRAFT_281105 [Cercophora samala]|uniref:DNA recombination and repair protein Rad51-like C-terminal domain-containing protein n=1 Tax=Cercophora samala TaxID=330535 RepID=A0AA39Z8Q2_9PEZI|nr:hypothetical protein QBC41DRAFT_281105 [Cercophora samala]